LCRMLDAVGLEYIVDPCLVRGLDYYGLTVFEWITTELGSQGAVCAGGHYDGLVEALGGHKTPAIGFALGMERLISLFAPNMTLNNAPHIYFVLLGEAAVNKGLLLAEKLRANLPAVRLVTNCGDGNLSQQLKRADKSGAVMALIIGENELQNECVAVKYLREDKPQKIIKFAEIIEEMRKINN
jgi:histidyl-tRNA synthetase